MIDVLPVNPRRFLSATIIEAPLADADTAIQSVFAEIVGGETVRSERALDLSLIYELAPPPGGAHLYKVVAFTPRPVPGVSVLITNLRDGWNSLSYLVSKKLGRFQLFVVSTESGVEYPQNWFETWRNGKSARSVMAMRDSDKWVFYQRGETECFEEPEHYQMRGNRDRLTREILIRYMRKLGWDIESREFWESPQSAIYYTQTSKKKVA